MNNTRRLYKSNDPVFAGVCGGVAEYFELDPTLIRILAVILVLAGVGLPIIAYIIAMLIMPKRSNNYPDYIDVRPANTSSWNPPVASPSAGPTPAQATASVASATAPSGSAGEATAPIGSVASAAASTASVASAPGCAYTTCNPQAYDAADQANPDSTNPQAGSHIRTGVMGGILLVGFGLLALFATFFDLSIWRFWPMFIMVLGFMVLCTPGRKGWSLARAGQGISFITIGFVIQLWTLDVISGSVFFRTFYYLWPILLVVLGLSVIGSATGQGVFRLFGSLLFSAALLFGVWSFGDVDGSVHIDLPGDRAIEFVIPSPPR